MKTVVIHQPGKVVFGLDSLNQFKEDVLVNEFKSLLILTIPEVRPFISNIIQTLESKGFSIIVDESITTEPTFTQVEKIFTSLNGRQIDAVVGIGGGSVLDAAKLIAALVDSDQALNDIIGVGMVSGRKPWLACLPTTSGTGSEVSPNALVFDDLIDLKKAAISPWLVPDAAYIDPKLTLSVPSQITAATGFDAMIHCLEAYINKNAHPYVDLYALEGIRLVGENLKRAVDDGNDIEARTNLALASLYGGQCLGPVNTAAIHALAYPLGNRYHIGHGLSVAVLLPAIFAYNIASDPEKHASIANALNAKTVVSDVDTAQNGVERIRELLKSCGLPLSFADLDIPENDIPDLSDDAIKVQRLLNNNPRIIEKSDIIKIYENVLN